MAADVRGEIRAATGSDRRCIRLKPAAAVSELKFRDPAKARALAGALGWSPVQIGRAPVSVMHVCGSHEQAIAKFGLRATFPQALERHHGARLPGLRHRLP